MINLIKKVLKYFQMEVFMKEIFSKECIMVMENLNRVLISVNTRATGVIT
jgi:hypothetical protein